MQKYQNNYFFGWQIQHPNYFSKANYLIYKKLKNKIIFLGKKTNYFGLQELFYIKMYVLYSKYLPHFCIFSETENTFSCPARKGSDTF